MNAYVTVVSSHRSCSCLYHAECCSTSELGLV